MKRIATLSTSSLLFTLISGATSSSAFAVTPTPTVTPTTTSTVEATETPEESTPTVATSTPTPSVEILTAEGIAGDIDIHDRDPILSFSIEKLSDGVHILADGTIKNDDYKKYPLKFDFFVNGELFTSQIRTPELQRSIGIIVPASVATTPFNYSIKLTLITPNREFTTLAQGSAE